ncbi:MAG: hypothetical protein AUG44_09380 [Actinobacteria bacterium 13_1_20CM_3_71_11]|nr:MAG: hypothetical protein AUG44_09380 [Actinobacteria bacterium 13_1_20CM_3_71_11]TML30882.1 MAG: hypothetical protein E6G35_05560 [Actinomycetota bacterium]
MPANLPSVIAAATTWLVRAYPASGGAFSTALAEIQARQAATVAAWLRYPTRVDAGLLTLVGPGGSQRLDWLVGADTSALPEADRAWRTWVDEVVVSWAACLLGDPRLSTLAVAALADGEHAGPAPGEFRRLTQPDDHDRRAGALLRHPDLLGPVADLHRPELLVRLGLGTAGTAAA